MKKALLPLMFSFFIMGFVDVVSIVTNYVKIDFKLSDSMANLLPMMVFLWFAVFSLPTSSVMNKFGRKQTVLFSVLLTSVAMLIPLVYYSFPTILLAFALLGISNTILQVSLNPLVTNVVNANEITRTLTLGQFVKAICSFTGPLIVTFATMFFGNWKLIFLIYAITSIGAFIWLLLTPIAAETSETDSKSFKQVWSLLRNRYTLLLFSIIVLIVGFEIGLLTTLPKYLQEKYNFDLNQGAYVISLYFIARTCGTFIGAIILTRINSKPILFYSMGIASVLLADCLLFQPIAIIYVSIFLVGLLCSNVFAIVFAEGLYTNPKQTNEISGLMIVGVAGGALLPPLMGILADAFSQKISMLLPIVCLIYICVAAHFMRKRTTSIESKNLIQ